MDEITRMEKDIKKYNDMIRETKITLRLENREDPVLEVTRMDCPSEDGVSGEGHGIGVVIATDTETVCRRVCLCDDCFREFSLQLGRGDPPSGELVWG